MPRAESRLILFQPWEAPLSSCSCQDGARGVADHCPRTRGQAAGCPQRDHGFMAGAAEQAGSTCWAPPFSNRICIRYPPTLSPWSRLFCLERLGELPTVTPAERGGTGAPTRHVCLHHLCPFCNWAGFVVTGRRLVSQQDCLVLLPKSPPLLPPFFFSLASLAFPFSSAPSPPPGRNLLWPFLWAWPCSRILLLRRSQF